MGSTVNGMKELRVSIPKHIIDYLKIKCILEEAQMSDVVTALLESCRQSELDGQKALKKK